MARGFDSKTVEEQQAAFTAKAAADRPPLRQLTPEQAVQQREREGLLLSRKQVATQLEAATATRRRAMLEQALAELDRKLGK